MVMVVMLVVVLIVILAMPLVMVLVIFGLRENRDGFIQRVYAATDKSLGDSSRFSQKMIVGICDCCYR